MILGQSGRRIWPAALLSMSFAWAMPSGTTFVSADERATAEIPAPASLKLEKGDRICLIGNTLAERMQYFGHFETLLHSRFPELELVVRNLGYSADELSLRPRSAKAASCTGRTGMAGSRQFGIEMPFPQG